MDGSFNELELNRVYQWPTAAKVVLLLMLLIILCFLGNYFFIAEQWALLRQAQQQNATLMPVMRQKKAMAENLPAYQQQAERIAQQEQQLLQQIPTQRDSANILREMSRLAQQHSLTITRVQWEKEQAISWLSSSNRVQSGLSSAGSKHVGPTKLSLRINAQGQYHQLGQFVAELSALPRIVLIDSLILSRDHTQASVAPLNMELLTSTYTYSVMEVEDLP
ncbi:type 4a pilus biogenesis protein PilO [Oceanisphaera pacifica]|uniref:Type 4a pilus biogenesis protein PilO n=1 Tax=Oceanisphaera pacifica TaxID=2818389 RepID=A0ABS3NCQ5_9GAMM|nr:type 4a pilus biogenesis protein PilO [Oceanisphaera pacifica]MBO1518384.1 type 4a pilus biogenesis protein PilO [Oceanisphaera pacifica]